MKESTVTIKGQAFPTGMGKPPAKRACCWQDFFKTMKINQWVEMQTTNPKLSNMYTAARSVGVEIRTQKVDGGAYRIWRIK